MIIRRSQPDRFVQIPNATIRDPRLSYRARGILAELLSFPDGWVTDADQVWRRARRERERAGEGRRQVYAAFDELAALGYIHRQVRRDERGRLVTDLYVFDSPVEQSVLEQMADGASPPGTRTGSRTGGSRPHQAEHESSQVAPTTSPPTTGQPTTGQPTVGGLEAYKNTEDEHGSTNTDPEHVGDGHFSGVLQSHLQVEGSSDGQIKTFDYSTRCGTDEARQAQAAALAEWMNQNAEPRT